MSRILKQPSISVRAPKSRFQPKEEEPSKIGQRVTIPSLDNLTGTLRYMGPVDFKTGIWAGVELDSKGQGKNDGSAQGKRYFTCPPKSGIFISASKIIIQPPALPISKPSTSVSTRRSNLPITRNGSSNTATPRMRASNSSTTSNSSVKKTSTLRSSAIPTTSSVARPPSMTRSPSSPAPPPLSASAPTNTTIESSPSSSSSSVPNKKPAPTPTPPPQRKQQTPMPSTPTPPVVNEHQETTNQLYEMLEKVQRERDQLLAQMKTKETAWERLVSSRESLSLQVQENESQCQRLSRELELAQSEVERLQHSLAERDASIAKNQRDEEKQTQDQKRIERLETLVRDLQNQLEAAKEEKVQLNREHAGAVEQVRRELAANESMTASLEKECEELRRAGLEAIRAYEDSVIQIKEKHELELKQKEQQIQQLEYNIADLKHKQSTLFDDDEQDIDTRLNEMRNASMSHTMNGSSTEADQRHRLEEQLELAMAELDHERVTIQTLQQEMEQMKIEHAQARQQALTMEQKYESLQADFEKELNDKKRLIEEADNAFEAQAKAEDEHYQMKLSKMALEKEFNELLESNKQLEQDYNNLMDEMLALEKQALKKPVDGGLAIVNTSADTTVLQEKIQQLEKENESHRNSLSAEKKQVTQLSKDLAELESLVENRVFGEADLEEKLEAERKKVASLERELNALKNRTSMHSKDILMSPTTIAGPSPTPSPHQKHNSNDDNLSKYCELCDGYGHDVLECKNELSLADGQLFCENCDDFGDHITDECPNQDETF
ncbi:hypothetical protein CU098_006189 [Rhizopus stolonifer]|uniref:CAP-Gly domain-containing protein n=1 Tax=Rhizopus stolonifer TaxID=4846 RepID=A0A367KVA2_RHIST|nr:hypothetical protein CU098_006189 [Rhizopus stolonifer]